MDEILMLGQKSCIQDIELKIYWMSKSITATKSQKFFYISGAQKLTWAKFLEFEFFFFIYMNRQGYIDITRKKINLSSHHLHT